MKMLIMVGSGTRDSRSLHLGNNIKNSLEKRGVDTGLLDLLEYSLPAFNVDTDRSKDYDSKTAEFLKTSKESDAFVWITPVYHGSYSSILKNALDWQHFFLDGKIVAFASNGGNANTSAVDHLTIVARTQHAVAIPTRICTDNPDYDDDKNLRSVNILERVEALCSELIDFTERFQKAKV